MTTTATIDHSPDRLEGFAPATLAVLARRGDDAAWDALVAKCQTPAFDRDALEAARGAFPGLRSSGQHVYSAPGIGTADGRSFHLTLGPGVAALAVVDLERRERAAREVRQAVSRLADVVATFLVDGDPVPDRVPSRVITEWSRKSRSRMVRAFASVDWSGLAVDGEPLAMVTLTYPGDWLAVAPDGATVKRHLKAFRQRFGRAVGRRLDGAWKLEFQRRGAPHFHLLMPVPAMVKGQRFEDWLSATWADIVGADDNGCYRCGGWLDALDVDLEVEHLCVCEDPDTERSRHLAAGTAVDFASTGRMSDPKRLAVYFLKHGTKTHDGKEYQHNVPAAWLCDSDGVADPGKGPGRFWGFWGMKPATVALDLDLEDFVAARRILRKVARARSRATAYSRAKHDPRVCLCHRSRVCHAMHAKAPRTRVLGASRLVGGFVIVNDGVALAGDLARALNLSRLARV